MSNKQFAIVKFGVAILFFTTFLSASLLPGIDRVKGQAPACPLTGGTIVEFGKEIRSDRSEAEAYAGPVSVSLPAGSYRVTLVSYDDHYNKPHQKQEAEQWYLIFQGNGETVATSSSISDLPSDEEWLVEVVDYHLAVPQQVTSLVAFHSVWPTKSEPNSITPVCAKLERTDGERPTATVAPTVTPTPTSEPGVTPTPTVSVTETAIPSSPTPTPQERVTATPAPVETVTPTPRPPKQSACARFNLEQGRTPGCPVQGRYEMIEVGTGRLLATWWAEKGWMDSGWITGIDLTWPEVWVEVFFYPYGSGPAVKMNIVNHAPGTEYGWLARGMCHSVEIEFPPDWSPPPPP